MPDAAIIFFLLVIGVFALISLIGGDGTKAAVTFFLSCCVAFGGLFTWLRVADVHRPQEVQLFWLHTITEDEETIQVFLEGDEVVNATLVLGRLYPDGCLVERTRLGKWKGGIKFDLLEDEVEYRVILPNEGSETDG